MNAQIQINNETPICQAQECPVFSRFWRKFLVWAVFFVACTSAAYADELPFQNGEELNYDIRYKYGIMVKGGTARYRTHKSSYGKKEAYKSSLDFKTTSFFDKIFKIRDTLTSYISVPELIPLYHERSVNEGGTHFTEELTIQKFSKNFSEARVKRYRQDGSIKSDTVLESNAMGFDILNIFAFARTLDYSSLKIGETIPMVTFIGTRKVNILVRYQGQSIIDKSDRLKYKTHKLSIDVTDEVFHESKSALEVWISDDKNRIPIKMKAKLKIGAAEADLSKYKNLKYPFDAEIKIPARN